MMVLIMTVTAGATMVIHGQIVIIQQASMMIHMMNVVIVMVMVLQMTV